MESQGFGASSRLAVSDTQLGMQDTMGYVSTFALRSAFCRSFATPALAFTIS